MKKLIAKLRTKSFWVALLGALALVVPRLVSIEAAALADKIANAIGSVLLLLGIAVSPPAVSGGAAESNDSDENSDTEDSENNSEDSQKQ